jgi:CRP-like cAMP-binding protein
MSLIIDRLETKPNTQNSNNVYCTEGVLLEKLNQYFPDSCLDRISLLQGLNQSEISNLLSQATIIQGNPGDRLIRQGDYDKTIYIILSGIAEVSKNEAPLELHNLLYPGNMFVENEIFKSGFCHANLTVLAPSEILIIPIDVDWQQDYAIASKLILNRLQEIARLKQAKSLIPQFSNPPIP